jgi:hypothetical protein
MATGEEAEHLLGRTRLRKVAGVVRPDLYGTNLYGNRQSATTQTVVHREPEPDSSQLGRGLSPQFLPVRNSDSTEKTEKTQRRAWR